MKKQSDSVGMFKGWNYLFVAAIVVIGVLIIFVVIEPIINAYAPSTRRRVPMTTEGDVTYMVWPHIEEDGNQEIVFAMAENGQDPKDYINISNSPAVSESPDIAVSEGAVTVTWWETNPQNNLDTKAVSMIITNEGTEFSDVVELDGLPDGPAIATKATAAQ